MALMWGETLSLDITPSIPQVRLSDEPFAFVRLRRNSAFTGANVAGLVCTFCVTPDEARVLAGLVAGLSPAEFAAAHDVSENTVRKQIANQWTKMHCNRVVDLVKLAVLAQS
ncbi:LuxR C-terminal-related transcriptional regulator [Cupriavidus basilensis]|uniref:LuxR C-terminal-related transcriptional regulator n=1 Tax=Cupriavidus basilensis TaxID=68895 RepID=A0ABT6AW00_9BURK|nr:LuxR C-terminal-related transcriptional regulator [Cupriavidus basilensis]MDF3836804.1 LuxR C-terminal-related transcriptional regulator [Cupriavidus basilensis]